MEDKHNKDLNVVTMVDILNKEKELDEYSNAVLNGSDDRDCTYSKGYIKRQALYSCLTCIPEAKLDHSKAIGVCLACCLTCHEKHELIEMFTKRNFKCDCGLKLSTCKLVSNKVTNEKNQYNQNFVGNYCTCHRPYPDVEDDVADEMIQCIICEDWYHTRHLYTKVPEAQSYSEMICGSCMSSKDTIFEHYVGLSLNILDSAETTANDSNLNVEQIDVDAGPSKKIKLSSVDLNGQFCKKPQLKNDNYDKGTTTFWTEGWRLNLCKCVNCLKLYSDNKVEYIIDPEDSVHSYEEKGKNNSRPTEFENSMAALTTLPHANQIDAITSYNNMKQKLFEFLQTFVTNNTIVTEQDISHFFRILSDNPDKVGQQPHFCR
ncbi:unnamed protein product [Diamesa serratosioi]